MPTFLKPVLVFAALLVAGVTHADIIDIDFSEYAPHTALTEVDGVTFSLIGGPDSAGAPTISRYSGSYSGLLTNTRHAGSYPTANILQFSFANAVNDLSFVFNNAGYSAYGRGASFYTAFNADGDVLETGSLSGALNSTFNVLASDVSRIAFNNNTTTSSWWFGVRSVTATEVPAPAPLALIALGLAGIALRRRLG